MRKEEMVKKMESRKGKKQKGTGRTNINKKDEHKQRDNTRALK